MTSEQCLCFGVAWASGVCDEICLARAVSNYRIKVWLLTMVL